MLARYVSRLVCSAPLVCLPWAATRSPAECFATPQAAVDGVRKTHSVMPRTAASGYRVTRTQSDLLLGREWATVVNCDHPEWPTQILSISTGPSLQLSHTGLDRVSSPIVIHAGDPIRLWRHEAFLQMQVAAISEENGSVGQTIRVRLTAARDGGSSLNTERSGVVAGPAYVEMRP